MVISSSTSRLLDQLKGDHVSLDLVRAFIYLEDLCVPHHLLYGILPHVSVAAEYLQGIDSDLHCRIAREDLAHGGYLREIPRVAVDVPRHRINEGPRRLYLDRHVGQHVLDRLEGDDLLVELLPFLGIGDRGLERALRDSHALGPDTRTGPVKGPHGKDEAHAFPTYNIFLRDFAILEDQLPCGRSPDAELLLLLPEGEAFHAFLQDEGGRTPAAFRAVGHGDDRIDFGLPAVGDPLLGAVQHVVVPHLARFRPDARRITPRVGLGEAESGEPLAARHVRQDTSFSAPRSRRAG